MRKGELKSQMVGEFLGGTFELTFDENVSVRDIGSKVRGAVYTWVFTELVFRHVLQENPCVNGYRTGRVQGITLTSLSSTSQVPNRKPIYYNYVTYC